MFGKMKKTLGATLLFAIVGAVVSIVPAAAQGQQKIAVIDSDRIVMESKRGKAALEKIKARQDEKLAEGRTLQQGLADLAKRLEEGAQSLSPDRLAEMKKEYESKAVALRRFQEDADSELNKLRDEALAAIEKDVIGIIDGIGKEGGYSLIFNKFRSGLLFAEDSVDITSQVIQRFDAVSG
ncbi:MAG: OmpH family outer membrane protein [Thermoanaerobaculia bacterium]|nr:OmpH family outer membrane protein [Thermoanaerobaculia bacterium]